MMTMMITIAKRLGILLCLLTVLLAMGCTEEPQEQVQEQEQTAGAEDRPSVGEVLEKAQERITEERDQYQQEMRRKIEQWRHRIDEYQARIGSEAPGAMQRGWFSLNAAWTKVQLQWDLFQKAEPSAWHESRAALERTLTDLEQAWGEAAAENQTQP